MDTSRRSLFKGLLGGLVAAVTTEAGDQRIQKRPRHGAGFVFYGKPGERVEWYDSKTGMCTTDPHT